MPFNLMESCGSYRNVREVKEFVFAGRDTAQRCSDQPGLLGNCFHAGHPGREPTLALVQ